MFGGTPRLTPRLIRRDRRHRGSAHVARRHKPTTFINTSGGGTNAGTTRIRSNNQMTWAGVRQVTGKQILADTGYGANGVSAGRDPKWDIVSNINARIADGSARSASTTRPRTGAPPSPTSGRS